MRTIICKKCGAPIDASLGECPLCGAVYYILPNEEPEDDTRVWNEDAHKIEAAIEKSGREPVSPEEPTAVIPPVPPEVKEEKPKLPVRKPPVKKPNNWVYAGAAAALLAVLTVVMCFMTGVFDFGKNTQTMPDLLRLDADVAVAQLKALDLNPNLVYEESKEAEGTVIAQSPDEGATITKRTGITLTISSGMAASPAPETEFVEVPELMDKSYEAAASTLGAMGLKVVKTEEFSSLADEGMVIRQSPLSGAKLEKGEIVTLTVSKGPEEMEFTLIITAGKGGSISPAGTVMVTEGESVTITVTPDEGYELSQLRIDGEDVGAVLEYTLENVDADHSIYAVFAAASSPEETPEPTPETDKPGLPASPTDLRIGG